jgi:hypothetical protein
LVTTLLIGWWFIFYPKRHYNPYKSLPINNKGDFVLVFWCYNNLVVSRKTILKCINLMSDYNINNMISKRQHVWICFYDNIKLSKIHTNFEFFVFLKHYNYR